MFISHSETIGIAIMLYRVHRNDLASAAELLSDGLPGSGEDVSVTVRHVYDPQDQQMPLGKVDLAKVNRLVVSGDNGSLIYEKSVDERFARLWYLPSGTTWIETARALVSRFERLPEAGAMGRLIDLIRPGARDPRRVELTHLTRAEFHAWRAGRWRRLWSITWKVLLGVGAAAGVAVALSQVFNLF